MPDKTKPVFFVYRRSLARLGSTQMRCFQLCATMQRYGSADFSFQTLAIPNLRTDFLRNLWAKTRKKDAIYIFVKDAIDRLHPESLAQLHARAGAILHDPIDRHMSTTPLENVDVHIASSFAQHRALTRHLEACGLGSAKVDVLLHQADTRLPADIVPPRDRLRMAYFGDPRNAFLPVEIMSHVQVVDVGLAKGMASHLAKFSSANFHYAVRPNEQTLSPDVIKPLTKAVTAARCGSPIMVNRAAHDAETLLGSDYPYFVDTVESFSVAETIERASAGFGGAEWRSAIDIMRALSARVEPGQTAKDLERILKALL